MSILLIVVLVIISFWPVFDWMKQRFLEPESFYAHGFLIPLVAAYLIFNKKDQLLKLKLKPEKTGLAILLISLLTHVFAFFFEINFISGFAFIGVVCGLVVYNCGFTFFRHIAFPVFFSVFMVPLPKTFTLGISFYMKIIAANIASYFMAFIIPLTNAGSMIYLPNGVLTVGAPCSGLKSLITLSALTLLFAYISGFSRKRKIIFFICALPIPLLSNIFRIMLLALVFYIYGAKAAMGWFHDFSGYLLFIIAFAGLALLRRLFLLWPEK